MTLAGDTTGTSGGRSGSAAGHSIQRDDVVGLFGTPDQTVGSVNEPVLQVEHGFEFNEKWIYERPRRETTRPRARVIYWQRYDFVGSVRIQENGQVVPESPADLLRLRKPGSA